MAFAYNLPGWKNIHLARELEEKLRVPIFLENDANMAAIGEHWRGVAQGVDNFVFIAIGTGTGSGVFVNGKLYRGRTGSAGEVYHMNIDWPRWAEDFGDSGHFESYVSGMGIAAEGRKALPPPAGSAASDLAAERDAYFVFEAFRQGDPNARSVLEKIFTMLGVGIVEYYLHSRSRLDCSGGRHREGRAGVHALHRRQGRSAHLQRECPAHQIELA